MRVSPVRLTNLAHGGVVLRLPDVPEAVACGESEEDVLDNARPVLEAVLECYVAEGRDLPAPSPIEGAPTVWTDLFDEGKWRPIFFTSGPV
ncbi:MAG: type II toxin-antitoxin system HicB family antitoxin [Allosphingosinicella sp.]